jgi:hypothetical protein
VTRYYAECHYPKCRHAECPGAAEAAKVKFLTCISVFTKKFEKKYFQDGDGDKSVNRPTTPTSLI